MIPLKDNIPNQRLPLVTIALIALNVVAFVISIWHAGGSVWSEIWNGPSATLVVHYGAIPYRFIHTSSHCGLTLADTVACTGQRGVVGNPGPQPVWWGTAFTGMFLHAGLLHIAGNMIFLAIFGPNVEDTLGHLGYLVFYLVGGLVALAAQIAIDPGSTAPTLGASGAIAAVLGGYIVLFPRARILTVVFIFFFFTLLDLPALVVLGLWFLEQLVLGSAGLTSPLGGGGGGVAYFAHVGGFVFGVVLVLLFIRVRGRPRGTPSAVGARSCDLACSGAKRPT